MLDNIKFAAKTTTITLLACGASTVITFIQLVIFGTENSNLLMMNPLTSGYLHLGMAHLFSNAVILFLSLCSDVNREYNALKIFYITVLIELVYLPAEIAGVSEIAIGISGTGYFLLSRYLFSWKEKSHIGIGIALLLALIEFNGLFSKSVTEDSAHWVHLLGIAFGYFSIRPLGEKLTSFKLAIPQKKV
jgi:hypothetical protein